MEEKNIRLVLIITLTIMVIIAGLLIITGIVFLPTNDTFCLDYYAKQHCELNNAEWDNTHILPFPSSGIICLKRLNNEYTRYNQHEIKINFSNSEIKECTKPPVINWFYRNN